MGQLLVRGMLAGLFASILAFGFAFVFGEPQVDHAIAFEEHLAATESAAEAQPATAASAHSHEHGEEALVSREVQSTIGLATGVVVYGTALGGLFALAFAFISGRLVHLPPRGTALLLAALGFLALYVVPYIKYPANPPAVGSEDTIGYRTQLYFGMMAFSLAAMAIAVAVGRQFLGQLSTWNAWLAGGATYVVLVGIAAYTLPAINEVPKAFSADVLWNFRVASFGIQAILWAAIALAFGALVDRDRRVTGATSRA